MGRRDGGSVRTVEAVGGRGRLEPVARIALAVLLIGIQFGGTLGATVLWEDYQGNSSVINAPNGLVAGPNYANNSGTDAQIIAALRTIAGNPANAVLTGTDANVNNVNVGAQPILCNTNNATGGNLDDPTGAFPPCAHDAQGRVTYALIKFAVAGTYTLSAAHDDQLDIDLSSDYTNTNYHGAVYDIPAGGVTGFTTDENTYDTIGSFSVGAANACALMRIYFNNAGGRNYEKLRWTTPTPVTQIIPATALFDPSLSASSLGCTGPITATGATSIALSKKIANGRVNSADQFTVSINQGATLVAASGTSGSSIGTQASTGAVTGTAGATYTLNDAMSAGSASALSAYTTSIACTRNGTAFTPGGASPNWTLTPTTGQTIVCAITNTGPVKPLLALAKTSNGPWTFAQIGSSYVLNVSNSGTAATSGTITVLDALPGGIVPNWSGTLVSGNWSCTFSGQNVTCTSATSIAIAASSPITLPVTVTASATNPLINYACVGGGGDLVTTPPTPGPANVDHCATASTTAAAGNINVTIGKSDASATYTPGGSASYVITIANTGTDSVAGNAVSDALPKGMTLSAQWTCSSSSACHGCTVSGAACLGGTAGTVGDGVTNILNGLSLDLAAGASLTVTVPVTYSSNPAAY
jgi:uncharacterized repeat protein (TIGR01451 family)